MKIRQRLALRFTLVSALVTGAIVLIIYILTRGFAHSDFVERLTQQSRLEALHYATPDVKNVMPSGSFLLVNPSISIFNGDGKLLHQRGNYEIPENWIGFLMESPTFTAERGDYTSVGRSYKIGDATYIVFVSDKDLPGQHELDILVKALTVAWIVSLILSYVAGLYFSAKALQPVNRVVTEVNQITKDNLSYRLKLTNDQKAADEIDELILTFNALLTRIERAFIAQKRFVQNASHELKTPLTAIMAEAELALSRERTPAEYQRTMEVITQETERLVTITHGLLTLTRLEEGGFTPEMENVDVSHLLHNTLTAFSLHHPGRVIEKTIADCNHFIYGNTQLLQIALLNVLDNAAKYSEDIIMLTCNSKNNAVHITIEDFGIGIPANELDRLYSPLFRGSNARQIPGAGLGLPLVHRIVKVHNGYMQIKSDEGKGTTCEIVIPHVASPA